MGMSLYNFKYNISIVNVILMKNTRFYEIYVINSNNSVVLFFILHLIVITSYPIGSFLLLLSPILSTPLLSDPTRCFTLHSAPLCSSLILHSAPLKFSSLLSAPLLSAPFSSSPHLPYPLCSTPLWGEENIRSVGFSKLCTYIKKLTTHDI